MGGKLVAIATLVVGGIIIADALIHPKGVAAFGNASVGVLRPTYNALLGKGSRGR